MSSVKFIWTVGPVYKHQTAAEKKAKRPKTILCHAIYYAGIIQARFTGQSEIDRHQRMADFCNSRHLAPRPAVECVADTNIPPLPRKPKAKAATPNPVEA